MSTLSPFDRDLARHRSPNPRGVPALQVADVLGSRRDDLPRLEGQAMTNGHCPRCGGDLELVTEDVPPPHYGKMVCQKCNLWQSWVSAPMTYERACGFRFPFGKYKNRTMAEIAEHDREYLEWAAATLDAKSVVRAIKCFLEGPIL